MGRDKQEKHVVCPGYTCSKEKQNSRTGKEARDSGGGGCYFKSQRPEVGEGSLPSTWTCGRTSKQLPRLGNMPVSSRSSCCSVTRGECRYGERAGAGRASSGGALEATVRTLTFALNAWEALQVCGALIWSDFDFYMSLLWLLCCQQKGQWGWGIMKARGRAIRNLLQ